MALAKDTSALLGKHDDFREGVVLTKIAQGDLVKVPVHSGQVLISYGSSTATVGSTQNNNDGSFYADTLTVNAGLTQGASIRDTIYGRVVGIRFARDSTSTWPFAVAIDGICYVVKNVVSRRDTSSNNGIDREVLMVIADDLSDGPHTVEVILSSDQTGGAQRKLIMFGWLAEASKGYASYRQSSIFQGPQALTTTPVQVTSFAFGTVRKLCFQDTSGAQRTVTVSNNGPVFRTLTVPPNGYAEHDFGTPAIVATWTVQADAAGVNCFAQQEGPLR